MPKVGLVTAFCPLIGVQTTGESRFVVDSKLKPVADHVKITFVPERVMARFGGLGGEEPATVMVIPVADVVIVHVSPLGELTVEKLGAVLVAKEAS